MNVISKLKSFLLCIGVFALSVAATVEEATAASTVIISESFDEDSDIGIFSQVSVASNFNWRWRENDFDGRFIEMNGFGADGPSDDWLILTNPLDLTPFSNPNLTFKFIARYGGPDIEVLVSQNYDADTHTNPADADWTALEFFTEGEINEPNQDSWDPQFTDVISLEDHISSSVTIAIHYTSESPESGEGAVWRIDDFLVSDSDPNAIILNAPLDFDIDPFSTANQEGFEEWLNQTFGGRNGTFIDGSFDSEYNEDWLISPPFEISSEDIPLLSFDHYTDGSGPNLEVFISTDYSPITQSDPSDATWTNLQIDFSGQDSDTWSSYSANSIYGFVGDDVYIGFKYTSDPEENAPGRLEGIANFCVFQVDSVPPLSTSISTSLPNPTTSEAVSFSAVTTGGKWPFTYQWNFGDGQSSTEATPEHTYENAGSYTVSVAVTDAEGTETTEVQIDFITVLNESNVFVKRNFEGPIDSEVPLPWTAYSVASDIDWHIDEESGRTGVFTRGFGADEPSEDWLISPAMEINEEAIPVLTFDIHSEFDGPFLEVLVSTDYDPSGNGANPTEATWSRLGIDFSQVEDNTWTTFSDISLTGFTGSVYVAFKYVSLGTEDGTGRTYGIDEVQIVNADALPVLSPVQIQASATDSTTEEAVLFSALGTGGKYPYTYLWNFGDGNTSSESTPSHVFAEPGVYTISLTVTDALGSEESTTAADLISVIDAESILLNLDLAGFDGDPIDEPWIGYSVLSSADWAYATFDNQQGAFINSFNADEESDDWLITPEFAIADGDMGQLSFDFYSFFSGGGFEVLVSSNYDPLEDEDPTSATWIPIEGNFDGDDWNRITNLPVTVTGESLHLAFHYTSTGTAAGDGRRIGIDNVQLFKTAAPVDENILLATDFAGASGAPIAAPWTGYSVASDADWRTDARSDRTGALMNGIGADGPSEDWLISPPIDVSEAAFPTLTFDFFTRFLGPDLEILASTDYDSAVNSDPTTATWNSLLINLDEAPTNSWSAISPVSLLGISSDSLVLAFKYTSTGEDAGQGKEIGIDNVTVTKEESNINLGTTFTASDRTLTTAETVTFTPFVNGGTRPYTFAWNFGDGMTSTDPSPSHQYTASGTYTVNLTITDAESVEASATIANMISVIDAELVLLQQDFSGADESAIQSPWASYSTTSEAVWQLDTFDDRQGAFMNGFGTDDASDDWLISPPFPLSNGEIAVLNMDFYTFFSGGGFEILVSNTYNPTIDEDPDSAMWSAAEADLQGEGWSTLTDLKLPAVRGDAVYLAFRYTSTGVAAGESRRIGVDQIFVLKEEAPISDTLTFADWKALFGYFEPDDPAGELTADPDNDGLNNALEYRFNLNPIEGYGFENLPRLSLNSVPPTLEYTRLADNESPWVIQFSSDLLTWTDAVEGTHIDTEIQGSDEPDGITETVTVDLSMIASEKELYWRVVAPEVP